MPAPTQNPTVGAPDTTGAAAANASIAAKVASQDINGTPTTTTPEEAKHVLDALDGLMAAKDPSKQQQAPPPVVEPKPDPAPSAAGQTPPAAGQTPPAAGQTPPEDPALRRANELFSGVSLPQGASVKSTEAFSTVKLRAAQEISKLEQEREALKKQIAEFNEKSKQPTPEQVSKENELKELREWRAKLDVEFDPKFKEFDKNIEAAREFIYAQLRQNPAINEDVIAEIKKFGGPEKVKFDKIWEAAKDPTLQRLVESKLADIAMARYQKDEALKSVKGNIGQYMVERESQFKQAATAHTSATQGTLDQILPKLDWFAEKKAADNADDAAKKEVAEHNKFVGELKGQIAEALKDDSPTMRAILIAGFAQFVNLQREHAKVNGQLKAAQESLKDITTKYEAVKKASVSRLANSNAPASGQLPGAAPKNPLTVSAGDALDSMMKQVMEQRAQAAANK